MSIYGLPPYDDAKKQFPPLRVSTEAGSGALTESTIDRAEDVLDKKLAAGQISPRTHQEMMDIYSRIRARFKPGHQTLDANIIE